MSGRRVSYGFIVVRLKTEPRRTASKMALHFSRVCVCMCVCVCMYV